MGTPLYINAVKVRLVIPSEQGYGPDIVAEWLHIPLIDVELLQRNAGIILYDGGAVFEQEIANAGKTIAVEEVRGAFNQAVAAAADLIAESSENRYAQSRYPRGRS